MTVFLLALNFLAVCLYSVDLFRRLGTSAVFHGAFLYVVFHTLVFLIRPITILAFGFEGGFNYLDIRPSDKELSFTVGLSLFGLICFYLGFVLRNNRTPKIEVVGVGQALPWRIYQRDVIAFTLIMLILTPLGLYSLSAASSMHENMIMIDGVRVFKSGNGYLYSAYNLLGGIAILFAYVNRFKIWSLLPLVIYVLYRIELGWGRFGFVLLLYSVFLIMIYQYRLNVRSLLILPFIMIIFQYAGRTRGEHNRDTIWYQKLDSLDFANFDFLVFITRNVPDRTGTFTYFTQYLQILTEPIPRALWPDKPVGPPIQMFDLNDYGNFIAATHSLVGDGWMSLSYPGVAIICFVTGWFTSVAYEWLIRHRHHRPSVLLYALAMPTLLIWYRDGGIHVAKILLFSVASILIWMLLRRFRWGSEAPRVHGAPHSRRKLGTRSL